MVRLVFRPYTQVGRPICTSGPLRTSTRVSSGFAPLKHSSPSFGSRQACSHSNPSQKIKVGRRCTPQRRSHPSASLHLPSFHTPSTCMHVRLLGPCFKTGRMGSPLDSARSAQVRRKRRAIEACTVSSTAPTALPRANQMPKAWTASTARNDPRAEPSG